MKVLVYSDVHSNWNYPDYMEYLDKTFDFLEETIKEVKPHILLNLGDNTDTFGIVDIKSLVWIRRRLQRLSWLMCDITGEDAPSHLVIKGNHDISDSAGSYATTEVFSDDATTVIMHPENIYSYGIACIPYTTDYEGVISYLTKLKESKDAPTLICGHLDWLGVRLTPHYVSKDGIDLNWYNEKIGIPFINGHYHTPSQSGNLHVVGSPLYKDFSDDTSVARGFMLVEYTPGVPESVGTWRIHNPNTYYLIQLKIEDEDGIKKIKKLPSKESIRIKIFAPTALVEKAKKAAKDFLWKSVYPTDSDKQQVDHQIGVSITSQPSDVVEAAVKGATGFKTELLRTYGMECFGI